VVTNCAGLKAADRKRLVIISEPMAKNTAPAIACAVVFCRLSSNITANTTMLVLTSDHIIKPLETFKKDAVIAASKASQNKLVVFGIKPLRPETGYGYIEISNAKKISTSVSTVKTFREKPDQNTAKKFCASKRFFWNSGIFAFSLKFISDEFSCHAPDVMAPFEKLKIPAKASFKSEKGINILDDWVGLKTAYHVTENISFDYAIAEKSSNAVMVHANFDWLDIGSWEDYVMLSQSKGTYNNYHRSEVFTVDSDSCHVDSDIPVALAGVDNLIVVIRTDKNGRSAALVTRKGQTHKVRDVVEQIKKSGRMDLI
jgi:mannose-1-phosphate guanylyltransferase/mannose-1-phosphate guanylyltransferase/mannose-6-phosphate isomerase